MIKEKLEKLGFEKATEHISKTEDLQKKLNLAYEHYRFVTQEKIDKFNEKIKEETKTENKNQMRYKQLMFTEIKNYGNVPPPDVLEELEKAQNIGCFDTYEIAQIEEVVIKKDPILFGRINDCQDRFYIAQWDDDVKIEDILNENEG